MFGIYFLNSAFLIGLIAVGIPVVIHLINRQRSRRIYFSTTRFLLSIDKRTTHRKRITDLISLILRMLIIALLVLAFSKPIIGNKPQDTQKKGDKTTIIILDDSYSMSKNIGGITLFEKASAIASDILKNLGEGDKSALILSSGGKSDRFSSITYKSYRLAEELKNLKCSYTSNPLTTAFTKASELIKKANTTTNDVVIISDMQANAFRDMKMSTEFPDNTNFYILNISDGSINNLSLEKISSSIALPFVDEEMKIHFNTRNYGNRQETTVANLWINENRVDSEEITIEPNSSSDGTLNYSFPSPGKYLCKVTIDDKYLNPDNQRFFIVEIFDKIKILLLSGSISQNPLLDETFFLKTALNPKSHNTEITNSNFICDEYSPDEIKKLDLSEYKIIIIANVQNLSKENVNRIEKYIYQGGNVIFFLGDNVINEAGNELYKPSSIFPLELRGIWGNAEEHSHSVGIGKVDYDHPIFSFFKNQSEIDFGTIKFFKGYQTYIPSELSETKVIAYYDNADPLIMETNYGLGKSIIFATTCNTKWNNLPTKPLFLPIIYETLKYMLMAEAHIESVLAGMPINIKPFLENDSTYIKLTNSENTSAYIDDSSILKSGIIYNKTDIPGMYKLTTASQNETKEYSFVVNTDPSEGNLKEIPEDELRQYFNNNYKVYTNPKKLIRTLKTNPDEYPLWDILLLLAVVCFVTESIVSNSLIPNKKQKVQQGFFAR